MVRAATIARCQALITVPIEADIPAIGDRTAAFGR